MWAKKRILVMEFIAGHRPDDLEYLDSNKIDRDEVSAALAHIFNEMIFGDGAPLHCDPHGGNIAVRKNNSRRQPNFDIILYDHGLYRDISTELRRNYAKLWLAVINSDEAGMREYSHKVAGVTDAQFPLFASAITGRDYTVLLKKEVVSSRSEEEKEAISSALGEGLLQELVQMLGKVPRIILLILKTNDLSKLFHTPHLLQPNIVKIGTYLRTTFSPHESSPQPRRKPSHPSRAPAHILDPSKVCNLHRLRGANGNHPQTR